MAEKNGKNLVERLYQIDEIEKMRKSVSDGLDYIDKRKDEIKAKVEELKETRADLKRGHAMEEGEELPFQKERGSRKNDVEEPRART